MNIVESIKEDINTDLMAALATANNETVDKTKITVETSITSVVLAFMKRASTETGLHLLHKLTKEGNFSQYNPLDSIFPADKINKLADEGNALISKIIPDKKSPLITFVSSYSGVRNASANRTNGIVTVLILNKLKEVSNAKGLDLGGLAELFADQKDFLIEKAPKNLIEKLSQHIGLGNLISLGSSIITTSATLSNKNDREKQKSLENNVKYATNENSSSSSGGSNIKNWILPAIFGIIVLGIAGYYFYSQMEPSEAETSIAKDTLVNINDSIKIDSLKPNKIDSASIGQNTGDTLLILNEEIEMPNGQKITLEKGSLAYTALNFLSDTSKITNKKISSSQAIFNDKGIDILPDQLENFSNLAKIMKAYPQSQIRVKVDDYQLVDSVSDNKNANKKAFAIKKILMNNGIQPIRIDAFGKTINAKASPALKAKELELTVMKK